ncbi:MAG: pyridoxal-phosphate dependent enzyme [Candidatus Bathyarchaeota archaeon]|nr:pyridoxal-phosphate dependent enzyme [Candidatus Bathyarchaeota archaeon]
MPESHAKPALCVHLVDLDKLLPHEDISQEILKKILDEILADGVFRQAIVVDRNTNVILDGEHRHAALKLLGCKVIPVIYVDYNSPDVVVQSWDEGGSLTKKDVIEAGLSGKRLPPKTSKHMIRDGHVLLHISAIEETVNLPLSALKNGIIQINMENVKKAMLVDLRDVLPHYARFLSTGIVDTPIIIDEKTNVLLAGYEVFQALDLLAVEKTPALKVNIKEVEIRSKLYSKTLTWEDILAAGINGPKLPSNSFEAVVKPLKINILLDDLRKPCEVIDSRTLRVYSSALELLFGGWPTPLVKLNSLSTERRSVWAKLEGYNPFSNSVKDRTGWAMVADALEKGELKEAIYEATSTNTGIAITAIANMLKVKTKLFIPKPVQKASDTYLKVLGAEVVRLPVELTVEAINQVDAEAKAQKATHLNQFENDANFKIHLKTTAREIDEQLKILNLQPTCIIGGLGTSGHMSAISYYFKTKYGDQVKIVGVQPAPKEVIPGIRRVETGMKWFHQAHFDMTVDVRQVEAIESAVNVARKEGLLIGLSAGAVVHAFQKVAAEEGVYVLVFPDTGYKYAEQFEKYFTAKH